MSNPMHRGGNGNKMAVGIAERHSVPVGVPSRSRSARSSTRAAQTELLLFIMARGGRMQWISG